MTSVWILISGFFVANFLWFVAVLNSSFLDYVNPKFIASSYDSNPNIELESILLKSLYKYIGKYFKTKTEDYYMHDYLNSGENRNKNIPVNLNLSNEVNVDGVDGVFEVGGVDIENKNTFNENLNLTKNEKNENFTNFTNFPILTE